MIGAIIAAILIFSVGFVAGCWFATAVYDRNGREANKQNDHEAL